MQKISVVDSHTGGEPTRVVVDGGPELGSGTMAQLRQRLQEDHDWLRRAVVLEPRGSDVLVGALLCKPVEAGSVAGVIFFNNVGYLGMCGHGAIGVAVTLAHLGRIGPGIHRLDTPVGTVTLQYHGGNAVTIRNVLSYRYRQAVAVDVQGYGTMHGDVAWGGNWFFLVEDHGQQLELGNVERLTDVAWNIRQALERQGITGRDGQVIDHIELVGPPEAAEADSKNFVLCPGKAYDRSPCGTGTSAKVACLMADGRLQPGQRWRQEGIVGSVFEAWGEPAEGGTVPSIRGSAYVTAEATLLLDPSDPLRTGIGP